MRMYNIKIVKINFVFESNSFGSTRKINFNFFIKVKNITLGYTLPQSVSRKVLMEKCRFYATAYNPFLYVKDKELRGTDPETNGSDAFPLYKQFVFGINVTF